MIRPGDGMSKACWCAHAKVNFAKVFVDLGGLLRLARSKSCGIYHRCAANKPMRALSRRVLCLVSYLPLRQDFASGHQRVTEGTVVEEWPGRTQT